jgi:hypothetical protein
MRHDSIDTPAQLRSMIAKLSASHPFTDEFSDRWKDRPYCAGAAREATGVWYTTQHEHWLGWLEGYEGPGAYGRQDSSRSARFVYNHIVNPQMLIYLAEAVGIHSQRLQEAAAAALTHRGETMSSMSGAIRKVVPWEVIQAAPLGGTIPTTMRQPAAPAGRIEGPNDSTDRPIRRTGLCTSIPETPPPPPTQDYDMSAVAQLVELVSTPISLVADRGTRTESRLAGQRLRARAARTRCCALCASPSGRCRIRTIPHK